MARFSGESATARHKQRMNLKALSGALLAVLCLVSIITQPATAQSQKPPRAKATPTPAGPPPIVPDANAELSGFKIGQHAYRFTTKIGRRDVALNYLLYLPESYGKDPYAKYPLIVFMHGSREIGKDPNMVRKAALPQQLEADPDFPAIVVSPQSTAFGWDSSVPVVTELLDELETRLSIDTEREYLTGLSMGAYGAWVLALKNQERFAAIVSVVGGYYYSARALCPLAEIPTWVFAGKKDRNVNPKESVAVVNALQACGGEPKFTLYEDANHDQGWQRAYSEPDLFQWLLEQRKHTSVG
jgi:predicted peptidase